MIFHTRSVDRFQEQSTGKLLQRRQRTIVQCELIFVCDACKCRLNVRLQTPIGYIYANAPTKSVDQVHDVVFSNFDISESVCSSQLMDALLMRWGCQRPLGYLGMTTKLQWPLC